MSPLETIAALGRADVFISPPTYHYDVAAAKNAPAPPSRPYPHLSKGAKARGLLPDGLA